LNVRYEICNSCLSHCTRKSWCIIYKCIQENCRSRNTYSVNYTCRLISNYLISVAYWFICSSIFVNYHIKTTFALLVARCKTVDSSQRTIHITRANLHTCSSGETQSRWIIKIWERVICSCTVCRSTDEAILVCGSIDVSSVSLSVSIEGKGYQNSNVDHHEDAAKYIGTVSFMWMFGSIFDILKSIRSWLLCTVLVHLNLIFIDQTLIIKILIISKTDQLRNIISVFLNIRLL